MRTQLQLCVIGLGSIGLLHCSIEKVSASIILVDDPLDFFEQPSNVSLKNPENFNNRKDEYIFFSITTVLLDPPLRTRQLTPYTKDELTHVQKGYIRAPSERSRPPPYLQGGFLYIKGWFSATLA